MNAFLLSVGTAVPPSSFSQRDILTFILERFNIRERTRQLYRKVLSNPSIEKRHFAMTDLAEILDGDLDHKNRRFEREGAILGSRALQSALTNANLLSTNVDFLVSATCTGYVCPGLSSHLIEQCALKPSVRVADLVGMGCGAAIPALDQARNFAVANPGTTAAVVCTEICSAAMVSNDAPDIVISNALFADGAAAVLLRCDPSLRGLAVRGFSSRTIPAYREELRFVSDGGHLKNRLDKTVPEKAAAAVSAALSDFGRVRFSHWVLHAGGEKVLDALAETLNLNEENLIGSRTVLRHFGNMSSPTVLFVLDHMLRSNSLTSGDKIAMASFGAGFSAYAAFLEWI